jgi:hypothetical protein
LFQGLFDGDGQLIGTGGTAVTAGIPFQELYGPGGIGIFQQLAESQGIAGAAPTKWTSCSLPSSRLKVI